MQFTPDEMEQTVRALSGGQQAKLCLLKLLLGGCDVLLLDEPARNLSPPTHSSGRRSATAAVHSYT